MAEIFLKRKWKKLRIKNNKVEKQAEAEVVPSSSSVKFKI